jgi:hypothetical protein
MTFHPLRSQSLSLSDHLATVEQFLNEHQVAHKSSELKSNDESGRNPGEGSQKLSGSIDPDEQVNCFMIYLISTCYPKVRRRLSHSLSKRLLALLSSMTGQQLERYLEERTLRESTRLKLNNLQLCGVVSSMISDAYDIPTMMQELKDKHHQAQKNSSAVPPDTREAGSLLKAMSETNELVMSGVSLPSELPSLYTKETCVDLHYLLLLALNKYNDAITRFYSHGKDPTDQEGQDLTKYSLLLWCLAHSSILQDHLVFLRENWLENPVRTPILHGFEARDRDGDRAGSEGMSEDEDVSSDEAEIKGEMAAIEGNPNHKQDLALMIQRWIRLLVSHLQAPYILSSLTSSSPGEIRIRHVAVKKNIFEAPQDWTSVLERALTVPNDNPPDEYPQLVDLILDSINEAHVGGSNCKGIFSYFKGEKIISAAGYVHCEAALAAALVSPPSDTTEPCATWLDVRLCLFRSTISDAFRRG